MQSHAKQINDISNAKDLTSLFPQFNNVIVELKNKKIDKDKNGCAIF